MDRWALILGCVLGVTQHGAAQTYPSRPIRLIVGFPAGGGVDLVARQLAEQLSAQLGSEVTVENVAGDGGNLASEQAARAEADGYTLLIVNPANIAINPSLSPALKFDPSKDFEPIARMVVTPLLAVVPASLPVESMRDFIELLRAKPGGFSYGSGGIGNINHLGVELFKMRSGTQIGHSPASSSSRALRDLVDGRVQFMMDGGHVVGRHVQEGKLKILASFSQTRLRAMPNTPTAAEVGLPDLVVSSWLGLVAPARTPKAVVARLQKEIEQALANPKFRDRLLAQGTQPAFLASDEFRVFVEAEQRRWAEVVRASGVKIR